MCKQAPNSRRRGKLRDHNQHKKPINELGLGGEHCAEVGGEGVRVPFVEEDSGPWWGQGEGKLRASQAHYSESRLGDHPSNWITSGYVWAGRGLIWTRLWDKIARLHAVSYT